MTRRTISAQEKLDSLLQAALPGPLTGHALLNARNPKNWEWESEGITHMAILCPDIYEGDISAEYNVDGAKVVILAQ